jgi:hypothetical protein
LRCICIGLADTQSPPSSTLVPRLSFPPREVRCILGLQGGRLCLAFSSALDGLARLDWGIMVGIRFMLACITDWVVGNIRYVDV